MSILQMSISIPTPPISLSAAKTISGGSILMDSLFLPVKPSHISLTLPGTFPVRTTPIQMGGGPRTYPGGVSKWQWKRMQAKKAKQLLKARLARERQIYEMRKRAELKAAVSELERPWETVEKPPNLFSVSADEQLKVLADRFQKPGGLDLWSERDGPELFRPDTGLPTARFFPKGVVHSIKPYGKTENLSNGSEDFQGSGSDGELDSDYIGGKDETMSVRKHGYLGNSSVSDSGQNGEVNLGGLGSRSFEGVDRDGEDGNLYKRNYEHKGSWRKNDSAVRNSSDVGLNGRKDGRNHVLGDNTRNSKGRGSYARGENTNSRAKSWEVALNRRDDGRNRQPGDAAGKSRGRLSYGRRENINSDETNSREVALYRRYDERSGRLYDNAGKSKGKYSYRRSENTNSEENNSREVALYRRNDGMKGRSGDSVGKSRGRYSYGRSENKNSKENMNSEENNSWELAFYRRDDVRNGQSGDSARKPRGRYSYGRGDNANSEIFDMSLLHDGSFGFDLDK